MKTKYIALVAALTLLPLAQSASAEVPTWVKNNAGWWADDSISESDFVLGVQFLIEKEILSVPSTAVSEQVSNEVPQWVKNNAGWWAAGEITDNDFVNGLQHLIKIGVMTVQTNNVAETQPVSNASDSSESEKLNAELNDCQEIKKAYERLNCEKEVESKMIALEYKTNGAAYSVGPMTFYYNGNDFEITSTGQAMLSISMLAENTGSSDNITMMCTGPSICNYDVWNGAKAFKYSGMDFTNGQIVLKPGEAREFSMLFGPNIGYGGTTFEYDSSKDYFFRISESWGSAQIPIQLG